MTPGREQEIRDLIAEYEAEGDVTRCFEAAKDCLKGPDLAGRLKRAISIIELLQSSGAYDEAIFELESMPEEK
jgi:hypothetical protein